MNFKQYLRYQMDFKGVWLQPSILLMGLSFFFRIVYYFGLTNLTQVNFLEIVFSMILPMVLCGGYIVLMRAMQVNNPAIYGMIGGALCVLAFFWSFSTGSIVRIILSLIVYPATGIILLATVCGYLPGRLLSSVLLVGLAVIRFLFFGLGKITLIGWCLEISVLAMLISLFCLTRGLVEIKQPRKKIRSQAQTN